VAFAVSEYLAAPHLCVTLTRTFQVQGKDVNAGTEGAEATSSVKEQHLQWQQQQQQQQPQQQQEHNQLSLAQPKKRLGPMRPRLPCSS
jgi:transcription initiation factor TFIID subunit TAF12